MVTLGIAGLGEQTQKVLASKAQGPRGSMRQAPSARAQHSGRCSVTDQCAYMSDSTSRPLTRDDFLFPAIEPHATGRLAARRPAQMYWEESGNPHGVPIVFLHGGPGGGATPHHRRFFDPDRSTASSSVDQRGAGRSTAARRDRRQHAPRTSSPTLSALRIHLRHRALGAFSAARGVRRWRSPTRGASRRACCGLVLRGIFLCRQRRSTGSCTACAQSFPEAWRAFAHFLPAEERADLFARLLPPPDRSRSGCAHAGGARLEPLRRRMLDAAAGPDPRALRRRPRGACDSRASRRITSRHAIFPARQRTPRQHRAHPPPSGAIVQGRYDVVCPHLASR